MRFENILIPVLAAIFIVSLIMSMCLMANPAIPKLFTGSFLSVFIFMSGFLFLIFRKISLLADDSRKKYDNLEKLSLDIRDGEKSFYKEKRKSLRIKNEITAKIVNNKVFDGLFKLRDISYEGALLRIDKPMEVGDVIELNIYLHLFPQPIDVKARVVRVLKLKTEGKSEVYDIGMKFIWMSRIDEEKLRETIDTLS
jgi:hypothetical protein